MTGLRNGAQYYWRAARRATHRSSVQRELHEAAHSWGPPPNQPRLRPKPDARAPRPLAGRRARVAEDRGCGQRADRGAGARPTGVLAQI
jgi:hypothetical protein